MMRWVLLASLAALASSVSPPDIPTDIAKYAIFLANSSAQETTTFTLQHTVIKITKHSAAESSALAKSRAPRIIVTDAAAKGLVCVGAGRVQLTPAGKVVEAGEVSTGAAASSASAAAGGDESHKAEELIVGQGDGVVASVSSAASASASGGAASASAASGGAAASSAAGGGGAASSAAAGEGSAASSAAGEGSAASSAAGEGSAASSAAGEGSAASSAAGEGSAASSAASEGGAASSASGEGSQATATGDSTSTSAVGTEGGISVDVSGQGEAAAYGGGEGVHLSGSGKITHIDERFCTCVPDYLCDDEGYINTAGAGLIDIRSFSKTKKTRAYASKCKETETCCKHRDNEQIGWFPSGCGDRSPIPLDRRVVGGEASGLGRFPWMVAIIRSIANGPDEYVCGGSLIREDVVLTGAHCVNKLKGERLIVRAGEWDTCNDDELYPHIDIEVASVIQHEGFNAATLYNDVALLQLVHGVEVQQHINTICLPDPQFSVDIHLDECVATGWGKESFENSQYTNILKEVPLRVVGHDACQEALRTTRLGKWFKLHDTFTCAGGEPHVDTCKGDGGSPLVCRIPSEFPGEDKFVQVGIVAWGIGCGKDGIPGVYADVQKLLPWIHEHMPHSDEYP
ncbi:phenoloxidase-activating factor 2-like [Amphibalanus amphitrite]|uniref:phenoloxidase-activating factor 2-like n=1 Tax=Amphibalanus amphitrite TaxID=1232801 RepID=UPI001C922D33|nr:phenoloxidase-activating factor 2-like [Amphibalanus amphitrite]